MQSIHSYAKAIGMPQDHPLINAFETVDRSKYVSPEYQKYLDQDYVLVNHKCISTRPTTMFLMSYVLNLDPSKKVLIIGTGQGYQTEKSSLKLQDKSIR